MGMTTQGSKYVFSFGSGQAEGDPKRRDLLGGKGAGLAEMTALGLPVPAGFTLSTELCLAAVQAKSSAFVVPGAREQIEAALARIEKDQGAKLGDPNAPLLVSVRSGARASMPGMMDTILNLGLNDEVTRGLAKKTNNPRFAYDAYRRLIAMYADVALGVKRTLFDQAVEDARARLATARGIDVTRINAEELKRRLPDSELPAEEWERIAASFLSIVKKETGKDFPSDPRAQLVEQPPRRRLPPHERHPRHVGNRVHRAGDGLRQPGGHERDRRGLLPQPGDG
jgi:pyruvate,orthophosphate dikinase